MALKKLSGEGTRPISGEQRKVRTETAPTQPEAREARDAYLKEVHSTMREARQTMDEGEKLMAEAGEAETFVTHRKPEAPSNEISRAVDEVRAAVRKVWHRYPRAIALLGALAIGGAGVAVDEYESRGQMGQEQGETQTEAVEAVTRDIMAILHTSPPQDQQAFDALIAKKVQERIARHGQRTATGPGSEVTTYVAVVRSHVADEVVKAAKTGQFEFALRTQPFVENFVTPMELCAHAHNPAAAVRELQSIVRSTSDSRTRDRLIAEALDDVADLDEGIDEDPYLTFVEEVTTHMRRVEAGSAQGRTSMQVLGGHLERGIHEQERMAVNWELRGEEEATDHAQNVAYEQERIQEAERILGTDPVTSRTEVQRRVRTAWNGPDGE